MPWFGVHNLAQLKETIGAEASATNELLRSTTTFVIETS
jgi:hypothetical protein